MDELKNSLINTVIKYECGLLRLNYLTYFELEKYETEKYGSCL